MSISRAPQHTAAAPTSPSTPSTVTFDTTAYRPLGLFDRLSLRFPFVATLPQPATEAALGHGGAPVVRGETVKISSFGTFSVRSKSARIGRNPKTGEEVPIEPRRVLTFRPSHIMKERVDAGNKS